MSSWPPPAHFLAAAEHRAEVAALSIRWAIRWQKEANMLEDLAGLDWQDAERQALAHIKEWMAREAPPAPPEDLSRRAPNGPGAWA